jgi:hypothetical protein
VCFEAEEELVRRCTITEVRRIEQRVVKLRQTVLSQHAERSRQTSEQNRPLITRDHERRPAEQRTACDVEWIAQGIDPDFHPVAGNETHETAQKTHQRDACLMEAQRFGCLFHGIGGIALHAAVTGAVRHLSRIHQLAGSIELSDQTVNSLVYRH